MRMTIDPELLTFPAPQMTGYDCVVSLAPAAPGPYYMTFTRRLLAEAPTDGLSVWVREEIRRCIDGEDTQGPPSAEMVRLHPRTVAEWEPTPEELAVMTAEAR